MDFLAKCAENHSRPAATSNAFINKFIKPQKEWYNIKYIESVMFCLHKLLKFKKTSKRRENGKCAFFLYLKRIPFTNACLNNTLNTRYHHHLFVVHWASFNLFNWNLRTCLKSLKTGQPLPPTRSIGNPISFYSNSIPFRLNWMFNPLNETISNIF